MCTIFPIIIIKRHGPIPSSAHILFCPSSLFSLAYVPSILYIVCVCVCVMTTRTAVVVFFFFFWFLV